MPSIRKLTYADHAKIPADGYRHEILGGIEGAPDLVVEILSPCWNPISSRP